MAASNQTSSTLLVQARNLGDQDAWRQVEARYGASVLRQAAREGLSDTDAEDLRQVVLCRLLEVLPRFEYRREVGRFRAYLRVLVRRAARRFRHVATGLPTGALATEACADPRSLDPDRAWERQWMASHLQRALAMVAGEVHPRSIEVFRRYLAGQDTAQIATTLGIAIEAVRKAKQRVQVRVTRQVQIQVAEEDTRAGPGLAGSRTAAQERE